MRLAAQFATLLRPILRLPVFSYGGILLIAFLGLGAAIQLQAGREMLGTTLFYASHPFNQAYSLVNGKFIGVNQLTIIAHAPGEGAFRDPQALAELEIFQHYMEEDAQFGGALAITNLAKSITRMFHEDVPKWEIIPDDINSTGQVIFRIISSAATPSEVEKFLSTDYRTTTVTFFYRDYSPEILDRILTRARTFMAQQQDGVVQFRIGGGILGVLAAVHTAVEHAFWRMISGFLLCAAIGGLFLGKSLRAVWQLLLGVLLTQGALLSVLWLGGIDLNMYTLPAIVLSVGVILIPLTLAFSESVDTQLHALCCAATGLTVVAAAVVWLFSPLRLQAEMGAFFIALALLLMVIPPGLKRSRV
jgi:predicted RND superfamily exporter protein